MKNIDLKKLVLTGLLIGSFSTLSANEGWYSGFGMGSNKIDLDSPTLNLISGNIPTNVTTNGFDDDDFGFALNGGYRMNEYVALNLDFSYTYTDARISYQELGVTNGAELDFSSYYITPGVHLIYPINQDFEVYGKLGVSIILTDIDYEERTNNVATFSESIKDWDIAPTVGFGGQWNFGENWAATFEYTYTEFQIQPITTSDVNIDGIDYETQNILVGLRYNFK